MDSNTLKVLKIRKKVKFLLVVISLVYIPFKYQYEITHITH